MRKLDGQVAIVTGGARGLGRAYALRLARLGAKVAVTDLSLESHLEFQDGTDDRISTVEQIRAEGGESLGFEFDIGERARMFAVVEEVKKAWGRVDVLIANAGGSRSSETTASLVSQDLLELVTRFNFYGTVYSCSAVAPVMKEQGSGRIVTVASYAGTVAGIGGSNAHYGASKAAIAHYTRHLAQELGPYGINANCIAPGIIATPRILTFIDGGRRDSAQAGEIALRRYGTVEDCARVIEFLSTDLSDYVTGALIPIDGGWNRAG